MAVIVPFQSSLAHLFHCAVLGERKMEPEQVEVILACTVSKTISFCKVIILFSCIPFGQSKQRLKIGEVVSKHFAIFLDRDTSEIHVPHSRLCIFFQRSSKASILRKPHIRVNQHDSFIGPLLSSVVWN